MRRCAQCCLDPPIARARENFFVRKLFQANQAPIPIKPSTPVCSNMLPMLVDPKLKPNGPLICSLQRLSAPNRSNRTDCSASNRISAYSSDSKVVDNRFVVSWERLALRLVDSQPSPPIEGWFGPHETMCTMLPRSTDCKSVG